MATKILDLELERLPTQIDTLEGYDQALVLFRFQGQPVGQSRIVIPSGRLTQIDLYQALASLDLTPLKQALLRCYFQEREPAPDNLSPQPAWPTVTVAVCTRNRTSDLLTCLQSLCKIDYAPLDILVVDNAPADGATKQLVTQFPQVRYICEPRPGLDWARNRAILESNSDILAFTDDDVSADADWVAVLAAVFANDPAVMAVTGLVLPLELETDAQELFEANGGFGRGYQRRWHGSEAESKRHGAGEFGTGANMAFRRTLFECIGLFDPALDVGTVTNGGGDLEIFFRLLQEGHTLVYEPSAVVYHRHRRDYAQLKRQITNNGIGLYSYFVRSALAYPNQRRMFAFLGIYWILYWSIRRLLLTFVRPMSTTRALILAELYGSLVGLGRYPQAQRVAARTEKQFGVQESYDPIPTEKGWQINVSGRNIAAPKDIPNSVDFAPIPVHLLELDKLLPDFANSQAHTQIRLYLELHGHLLGATDLFNHHKPISRLRLLDAISQGIAEQLPMLVEDLQLGELHTWAVRQLAQLAQAQIVDSKLSARHSVSIVVATFDRPDRLRNCLRQLKAQVSSRKIEIVIVDNHPASGVTAPVLAEFPDVRLVNEPRQGLAYARNAGFLASRGDLLVATDDDVIMPSDWLEKLLAPFADPNVMAVTGNVLPLELETEAQQLFEVYGGLGRGFKAKRVGRAWFHSFRWRGVPTWFLGATANAAFRAILFHDPQIGLMDEALGPGMPSGVGEDTYLFYKILKAGFDIVYQPNAYVWHQHRRDLAALRKQLYDYSKGHIAYHLTTWLNDGDWRGLCHLILYMPLARFIQIAGVALWQLVGVGRYPLSLLLLEVRGNWAGPWALWRARQRVKRAGRSRPIAVDTPNPVYSSRFENNKPYDASPTST